MKLDLVLDIGNTRSKWVLTATNSSLMQPVQEGHLANQDILNQQQSLVDHIIANHQQSAIINIYCSCVGPLEVLALWQNAFPSAHFYQLKGDAKLPGFQNHYQRPTELGTDRLAGMFGAHQLYPETNSLVVSLGTATTIDYLVKGNVFAGGWILPGLELMFQALGNSTSQLPTLSTHHLARENANSGSGHTSSKSPIVLGTSTKQAIEMGIILSTVGAIHQAIAQCMPLDFVLLTGGNATLIENYLNEIQIKSKVVTHSDLILRGIHAWGLQIKELAN